MLILEYISPIAGTVIYIKILSQVSLLQSKALAMASISGNPITLSLKKILFKVIVMAFTSNL
jgi:hypothetical protein